MDTFLIRYVRGLTSFYNPNNFCIVYELWLLTFDKSNFKSLWIMNENVFFKLQVKSFVSLIDNWDFYATLIIKFENHWNFLNWNNLTEWILFNGNP